MRAAVLKAPRQVILSEVPPPEPRAGEVRVRLDGAGICASELPVWHGREWFRYPRPAGEPGHEGWGRIEALGPGVSSVVPGERVACISHRAHAEFDTCPAEHVVPLPRELDALSAVPGEPLACAVNAVKRSGIKPGDRVAVVGCGFLGLLIVALCSSVAQELAVISRRDGGLELAGANGATAAWRPDDAGLMHRPPFDVVFEATGYQEPLDLAGRLVRTRGTLVIAGYHQDGKRTVDMQLWNWRGLDVVNAHERDPAVYVSGLRAGLDAVVSGRVNLGSLITHRYPLEALGDAYRTAAQRPSGFLKAVWCRG